ncbi:MAG: amidohydrolase [Sphingobacteriaceae bacterium]|nr:amidohydrolase [Sphingobacteriaceae bacterium]
MQSFSTGTTYSTFHDYRRQLHQQPEISGKESQTSLQLQRWLAAYEPHELIKDLGGAGFCAVFDSRKAGPTLLFRAELDALPIHENNAFAHASKVAGVSHKCGHDGHMAVLLALASRINAQPPARGKVILLFQPAEETGAGAALVLADERFTALQPDYVYALHNLPGYALGEVLLRDGAFAAASAGLVLELQGKTSHAGHPEQGLNPATALSELLQALPELPQQLGAAFGLITIVGCQLGERNFGISAGEGSLACTIRAFEQAHFEKIQQAALDLAKSIADKHGLDWSFSWHEAFAAVENHPQCNQKVAAAAQKLGYVQQQVADPFRWSEDFGLFTQKYPGSLFGLGSGEDCPALHHPDYDFPDALIEVGSQLFFQIIREELG